MELKMNKYQLPEKVSFNYEELKSAIQEKVSQYETLIYSDQQIKEAKADKAQLNKLKKALNDERIRLQKEYMIPFNEFKTKIDELIRIIDNPVALIDKQIKEADEQKKAEKLEQIQKYWSSVVSPDHPLKFERVMDLKWLNATVSMKSIQESINSILAKYAEDVATLQKLPEYDFEAIEVYKTTLDLGKALNEAHRLSEVAKQKAEAKKLEAERKAEQERKNAEAEEALKEAVNNISEAAKQAGMAIVEGANKILEEFKTEPLREAICFRAYLTVEDSKALKAFFESRNIPFEAI